MDKKLLEVKSILMEKKQLNTFLKQKTVAESYNLPWLYYHLENIKNKYPELSSLTYSFQQLEYRFSVLLLYIPLQRQSMCYFYHHGEIACISSHPDSSMLIHLKQELGQSAFLSKFFRSIDHIPPHNRFQLSNENYELYFYPDFLWIMDSNNRNHYYIYPVDTDLIYEVKNNMVKAHHFHPIQLVDFHVPRELEYFFYDHQNIYSLNYYRRKMNSK